MADHNRLQHRKEVYVNDVTTVFLAIYQHLDLHYMHRNVKA